MTAVQATGKLIQKITIAVVINNLGSYIRLISKSALFDQVISEFYSLNHATPKKCLEVGKQDYTGLTHSFAMIQTFNLAYY